MRSTPHAPLRWMVVRASCALVAVLVTALRWLGDQDAKSGRIRIGVNRLTTCRRSSPKARRGCSPMRSRNNIRLLWNSAGNDVSTQASQVDQLINQRVNRDRQSFPSKPTRSDRKLGVPRRRPASRSSSSTPPSPTVTRSPPRCCLTTSPAGAQGDGDDGPKRLGGQGNNRDPAGPASAPHRNWTAPRGIESVLAKYPGNQGARQRHRKLEGATRR